MTRSVLDGSRLATIFLRPDYNRKSTSLKTDYGYVQYVLSRRKYPPSPNHVSVIESPAVNWLTIEINIDRSEVRRSSTSHVNTVKI
jgi:hypothetical protein